MPFRPPERLIVLETDHWILNHRVDAELPGYLMLAARQETIRLNEIPPAGLAEMGPLLARTQQALTDLFAPPHFYISRYGHMSGFSIHFHIIPVHAWLHARYCEAARAAGKPDADDPDGADLTTFIWRNYCEGQKPGLPEGTLGVEDAVERLRMSMNVQY